MHSYENYVDFRNELHRDQIARKAMRSDYFDIIEGEIINEEKDLDTLLENKAQNLDELNALIERHEILKKITQLTNMNTNSNFVQNSFNNSNSFLNNDNIINENFGNFSNNRINNVNNRDSNNYTDESMGNGLQFISGVILAKNQLKLRRTVFRVSYGLGLTTFWDLNQDDISKIELNDEKIFNSNVSSKKIFTIFLKSSDPENNYLLGKLIKICDALGASRYNVPPSHSLQGVLREIQSDIHKLETVLLEQSNSIKSLIKNKIGTKIQPGKYALYRVFFKKQKEIYLNLCKCKSSNNFFDGNIWVLEKKFDEILNSIIGLSNRSSNHHGTNIIAIENNNETNSPPTFIETNEFIWPFQEIVNTYGIPRYQEINPTVFNIITFPFLFGVMFGDIGHGFILLLFALYLCLFSDGIRSNKDSLLRVLLPGRYLLLFMGIFALYCGFIYNEFFSLALPIFGGSCYTQEREVRNVKEYIRSDRGCVYKFGMDPKWQMSSNELSFHNSVKMKLSVILGVFHMLFGIVLKGVNNIHFKNNLAFIFEFIPQIIFMLLLFGYMDFMIIIKWLGNWDGKEGDSPSLITLLMDIFLKFGSVV